MIAIGRIHTTKTSDVLFSNPFGNKKAEHPRHLPGLYIFIDIRSKFHLQLGIKIDWLSNGRAGQLQHSLAQVRRRTLDCTPFMNQSFDLYIEMKATFTVRAGREMLLYNRYFLKAEFPINIQMKTRNSLNAVHTFFFHNFRFL